MRRSVPVDAKEESPGIRRFVRSKVRIPIRIVIRDNMKTKPFLGHGTDISRGGLGVLVPADLSLGIRVSVELDLPWPLGKIQLAGIVRNRQECFYGVEFLDGENGLGTQLATEEQLMLPTALHTSVEASSRL